MNPLHGFPEVFCFVLRSCRIPKCSGFLLGCSKRCFFAFSVWLQRIEWVNIVCFQETETHVSSVLNFEWLMGHIGFFRIGEVCLLQFFVKFLLKLCFLNSQR